ncbi:MAG: biliverdin-producing heme oxygenase [Pseudomonadota bacterium]|nr:biliverdin-producing heme oxygenase [Pseudomonadota bacterium]
MGIKAAMRSQESIPLSAVDVTTLPEDLRLSARLRNATRLEHKLIESASGLPDAVRSLDDYRRCLLTFYGMFCPLERHFAAFDEWRALGLSIQHCARVPALRVDLRILNCDPVLWREAPASSLPALPMFPFALGALYVFEGSVLGGQIIMATLRQRLHQSVDLPGNFFAGRGDTTLPRWQHFRQMLDRYGEQFPDRQAAVIAGAQRTFHALAAWFDDNKADQT